VESERGIGSVFHCTARFGRQPGDAERPKPERLDGQVLVVDDNASARGILAMLLESLGLHTGTAADGDEALRELARADAANEPYTLSNRRMPRPPR
jgi:PleD family two-component response regulator